MFPQTLLRRIGTPLTIIALVWAFAFPAMAGGGGSPTGPTVHLSPPSATLDDQGGVIVTTTLVCWDDAVASGHVSVSVSLGQQRAGGGAWIETPCISVVPTTSRTFNPPTGSP